MQYNTPQQQRRPTKDYAPRKRKSRAASILPLMLLFVVLLAVMYMIFPKEAGHQAGTSKYRGLVISEVMSANSAAVPDENGDFPDWLEIYNGTGAALNLEGVMLTNRTDRICFPFPAYVLQPQERVIVFADNTYQLDIGKPFHGKFKLASVGTTLYMYDPDMYLIDRVDVPTLAADETYSLMGYDEQGKPIYEVTSYYSPGFENTEAGFQAYRAKDAISAGDLIINELCPDPKVGIPDEDGEIVDWVELRNCSAHDISLKGYALSDKEHKPLKWRFPDTAVVPAGGYYLVYCSGKDKLQLNGVPHTNFSISAERETIVLSDAYGRQIDRVTVEDVPVDQSVGYNETGVLVYFTLPTPGLPNNSAGQARADDFIRAFNPTGVYITEVMASNDTTVLGPSGQTSDYLELYNSSAQDQDLSFYGLSDNLNRPRRWRFPQGTVIKAGQYMVVYLDAQPELSTYYEQHTNFKLTRAGGEAVSFCDPSGKVLDRIPLSMIPTDHSYGRTQGMGGFFYYDAPTPGAANGTGYYGYVNTPSFSQRGGQYTGTLNVTLTIPEGSVVYYTTNGDEPSTDRESAVEYHPGDILQLTRTTVLRARAFDPSGQLQPSETVTQTYLMNVYHAFSIVCLTGDTDTLWNKQNGMLTVDDDIIYDKIRFKTARGDFPIYRLYGKTFREGFVEYYDKESGEQILSQGMEFGLQGQYSLDMPQKTFKVKAKAAYGGKYFDAALFDTREFTQYKAFVLRMGGNDCVWTRFIDAFQSTLIDRFNAVSANPTDVIHQAWKPVVVYLNGMYWGHYNMRERADRFFIAQHEGIGLENADNMDVLEASGTVAFGSKAEYSALIKKAKTLSPGKSEEDLQYITDRIDVDNYFDYMALEMFFGNSDPGNIRFYKLKEEGSKWKWLFYDVDYGLFSSSFNSPKSYLKEAGAGDQRINNTLIRKLLENDAMKEKFLRRLGEIFQVYTTEFMTQVFDEMAAILEPEMEMHFNRWAEENLKAINVDSPTTPAGAMRYWKKRLDYTRNVLKKRPTLFYGMVQEQFNLSDAKMTEYFGPKPPMPADALM